MDDKNGKRSRISAGNGSIVINGDVNGSNVILGNNNAVYAANISKVFEPLYRAVDEHPKLSPAEKADVKAELRDVEKEIQKGDQVNESDVARRLRNIRRMAPDILDVALAALSGPVAGLGMVAKKLAERLAGDVKSQG